MTKRVSVHGIEMAYEEHGAGTRPLLVVHGFTGSRRDFAPRVAALAAMGRVVLPDLRGHGESMNTGEERGYTLEQLSADLVAFLDALAIPACDLLGHSLGGMLALRVALTAPERVASLILMDTSARAPELPAEPFRLARKVLEAAGIEKLIEILRRRGPDDPGRLPADRRLEAEWGEGYWRDWRLPNYRAMDPVAYGALGEALFGQAPLGARIGAIRCPTLVMVGEGDTAFLAPAAELAAAIPGARTVTIPDAGHQPQLENPEAWLAAIRAHLEQVRSAASVAPR
jgi:2-succinyl-6-hydroxy-2,4-cyclohexadiene-1-carboxylate synthase